MRAVCSEPAAFSAACRAPETAESSSAFQAGWCVCRLSLSPPLAKTQRNEVWLISTRITCALHKLSAAPWHLTMSRMKLRKAAGRPSLATRKSDEGVVSRTCCGFDLRRLASKLICSCRSHFTTCKNVRLSTNSPRCTWFF